MPFSFVLFFFNLLLVILFFFAIIFSFPLQTAIIDLG